MKKYPDKKTLFSLLAIGLFASFVGAKLQWLGPKIAPSLSGATAAVIESQTSPVPLLSLAPATPPVVTLGFVGDIMLDRGVKEKVMQNFGGDYSKLFANADFLKTPDIMFANLEGPVSDVGTDKHNLYSFRMDPQVIQAIKNAGVDVVSVANNHEDDWGLAAYVDTINRLRAGGIIPCGGGLNHSEAVQPAVVEKDGYKVGFLCFTDVGPNELAATDTQAGLLLASDPNFDSIVKNAAANVNALIVSFHWGIEYQAAHTARQAELAARAVADGAVMVEGEHPHVAEDTTEYNGIPVLYSLGNFIFDQPFSEATTHGLFVTASLSGKTVSDIVPHTVTLDSNFAPSLDTQ